MDSDEEEVIVDPTVAKLQKLPQLNIRQQDLPDHLFQKVQLYLVDALGLDGGKKKGDDDDDEDGGAAAAAGGGGEGGEVDNTPAGKERAKNEAVLKAFAGKMEKDVAKDVKTNCDEEPEFNELPGKGPWQCIVGKSFAGSITHEASHICFFDLGNTRESVLLFKSLAVQAQ